MSWVSLSGSDGAKSGENSYKEVAKQAFASPTNLSSRLGNRNPSKDGLNVAESKPFSNRRPASSNKIQSEDEAENFHQMFDSTAVQVPVPPNKKPKSDGDLGGGLKSLAALATRQYYGGPNVSSTDAEASGIASSSSTGKESFSIGSVSRRTKDLDLAHNDNSFHVIGGLIVEFFQSKRKAGNDDLRLTPHDLAQLDRLAPPRVRDSFVEAVRYRFTNAPMDSTNSVHILARQCHDLGLDAEGPYNPLLAAAETEIIIPIKRAADKSSASSRASSSGASSRGGSEAGRYETPSVPSSAGENQATANPSTNLPSFGRPPRQDAADPPTGRGEASISSRLTKLGIEVPMSSDSSSMGIASTSAASVTSHSETSAYMGQQPTAAASMQGTVTSSLTKFGIEMPRYEDVASASARSVVSDGKSMATSLTRLGVEMPLQNNSSGYASSARSESGASQVSASNNSHHSKVSSASNNNNNTHQSKQIVQPFVETVVSDPAVLSIMSGTDDGSSILPAGSSKDFGGLAKQQLVAELREASNLMAESKTQEAAKFWRDHVLELEARLEALEGGGNASVSSGPQKPAKTLTQLIEQSHSRESSQGKGMIENPVVMAGSGDRNGQYVPPSPNESYVGDDMQNAIEMGATRGPLMIDPSLEGVPMVDVVAPADLPGGYHFEAEIEGRRFLATVPSGGVQKGETFSCYMRDMEKVGSDIPVGRWRDGLFDCFSIGCCHPVICNALFCPLVLLGQIMTRVGFDFLGRPSLDNSINGPNTLWTIMSFWLFVNLILFCAYNLKWSQGMELSMADLGALAFVNVAYTLFVVYLTSATRGSLREKYYIRESRFHDLEDCCCATFCLPCSVCQMARHTADYDEYEGVCCNDTGLPDAYESHHEEGTSPKSNYIV